MDKSKQFEMARIMYVRILRPMLYQKIADSSNKVDDWIMLILDKIFEVEDDE